ncbi:DciA family protein [Streptomyces sp. NPDC056192]|uniref:DciA family protein n=1 Tax=Streptomyces sp. NPDC056192 TaxID=3345743 RepID=UPI0035E3939A
MTDQPVNGVDLARVALQNARAAAKANPQPKRRMGASAPRRVRTGGRDPIGFAAALEQMMAERGWDMAAKGGSILDQWPTIAPELAGKVAAVKFDDESRTLHLRPVSRAYGLQLELHQRQIIDQVNAKVGDGTVRQLKVLAHGVVDTPATAPEAAAETPNRQSSPAPAPKPKNPGYLAAIAAHQEHKQTRDHEMDARVRAAAERQNKALTRRREPEDAFTEVAAQMEILRAQNQRRGGAQPIRRAFDVA